MYTSHREATMSESTLLYRHDCFDCVVNSWRLQIWLREMIFYIFLGFFKVVSWEIPFLFLICDRCHRVFINGTPSESANL